MEIEKKYLVEKLPKNLDSYKHYSIEQSYLCSEPTIRIRKRDDDFFLTIKNRKNKSASKLNVSEEIEMNISKESYYHLKEKIDGISIEKTRYLIPYQDYTIELDVFGGEMKGFCMAEVEFPSEEKALEFVKPDWLDKDVSGDYRYTNNYFSKKSL